MNETMTQIINAATPILCLLITAGGAYLVALLKRQTAQIEKDLDNETAAKYMNMAVDAVAQAVAYTAQTFADSLKAEGKFTKEKQLEAFEKSKNKTLEILGDTTVAALREIYGDFDAWLETKIEQVLQRNQGRQRVPDQGSNGRRSNNRGKRSGNDRHHCGAAARSRSSGR